MSGPEPKLPPALETLLATLVQRGHAAHVVGPGARALLADEPVREFEVATSADARELLAVFPTAVPLDGARRRLMLPTAAGSVDLVPYAPELDIRAALARRDFTMHALAIDAGGTVLDPFGGRADAQRRQLRCVAAAAQRFADDPLCALRALRLVATRELELDAELAAALPAAAAGLGALPAALLRAELHALLLGDGARRALELLRASGLEAVLAPGTADDAARVVGALPADLELRLAGWLRGSRAVRSLRRLREPRARVIAVERLLHLHPIDALVRPSQDARLRRLVRRSGALLPGLLALRAAELAGKDADEATRSFDRLRAALESELGHEQGEAASGLALDGRAVMEILGCAPGPEVGRALRVLEKAARAEPRCNTAAALRERLLAWRSGDPRKEQES